MGNRCESYLRGKCIFSVSPYSSCDAVLLAHFLGLPPDKQPVKCLLFAPGKWFTMLSGCSSYLKQKLRLRCSLDLPLVLSLRQSGHKQNLRFFLFGSISVAAVCSNSTRMRKFTVLLVQNCELVKNLSHPSSVLVFFVRNFDRIFAADCLSVTPMVKIVNGVS